jgi:putative intracellular protease/amidase
MKHPRTGGCAILIAVLTFAAPVGAQTGNPAGAKRNIAILVYDGVQVLDFAGPFEVFSRLNRDSVFLVSKDGRPVQTWRGLAVTPSFALAASPKPDVIVIPGGNPGRIGSDTVVLNWIRAATSDSAYVLSVCSGTFILLRAGVLKDRDATTFWRQQESLASQGAAQGVHVVTDHPAVASGRVVTSSGSGIEGALLVLGKLHGEAWQRLTALHMDVNPDPGSEATVRPKLADRNLPTALDELVPEESELLDYSGSRESWNQTWRFASTESAMALSARIDAALTTNGKWKRVAGAPIGDRDARWSFTGLDGSPWLGAIHVDKSNGMVELAIRVWHARD